MSVNNLKNSDFFWSYSKNIIFNTCRRRYFYRYLSLKTPFISYEEKRKIKIQKKLISLDLWLKNFIVDTVKKHHVFSGSTEKMTVREIREFFKRIISNQIQASSKYSFSEQNSKIILDIYFGKTPKKIYREISEKLSEYFANFAFFYETYNLFRTRNPDWFLEKMPLAFVFDGIKVWVNMDFCRRNDEEMRIYNLMAGKKMPEKSQLQLYSDVCAAAILTLTKTYSKFNICTLLLPHGLDYNSDNFNYNLFSNFIKKDTQKMLSFENEILSLNDIEKTSDERNCEVCEFKNIC